MKWVVLSLLVPFTAICLYALTRNKPITSKTNRLKQTRIVYPIVEQWSYDYKVKFNATEVVYHQMSMINKKYKERNLKFYPDLYPVVFEGPTPVVQNIPAFTTLTEEYLARNGNELRTVRRQRTPRFINYDDSKPFSEIIKESYDNIKTSRTDYERELELYFVNQKMSTRDLLKKLNDTMNDDYYYYSGIIQSLGKKISDLVEYHTKELMFSQRDRSSNIWISGVGTSIRAHYDAMHNFNVQIQGQKKWILYPPSSWTFMYLYPRLHPCHRYSQVNPDADKKRFPEFDKGISTITNNGPYEVTLKPGDLLYIPPYWFHEVVNVGKETSISFNVWTDGEENEAFELLMRAPLPFMDSWSHEKKYFAVRFFVEQSISKYLNAVKKVDNIDRLVYKYTDVGDYINKVLIEARYKPLFEVGQLKRDIDKRVCAFDAKNADVKEISNNEMFIKYTQGVADLALLISPNIRDIVIGNYIEEVVSWVAEPEYVGAFLNNCFQNEYIKNK